MKSDIIKLARYDNGKGMTPHGAQAEAVLRKVRIASNLEIDLRLQGEEWKTEKEMYPCWTGTLIVYEAPGEVFGKTIQFDSLTFNVPKKFQGLRDRAIVMNHPDFLLSGNILTPGKSAVDIPFPGEDGWYLPEPQFGIPSPLGGKTSDDGNSRHLWRRDEQYVGLVSRWYFRWDGWDRRGVDCYCRPGGRLGVFGTTSGNVKLPRTCSANRTGRTLAEPRSPHKHEWTCRTCGAELGGKKK